MRSPWEVMHAIDRIYTDRPFYGVRRIWKTLRDDGYLVNRKRVHRLMQLMGLQAIYASAYRCLTRRTASAFLLYRSSSDRGLFSQAGAENAGFTS